MMNEMKEVREKIKSLHVLVVDDEEKILTGTTLFLKKFFEDVNSAENGKVALEMFKNNSKYDVVITDVKMPKMSGWDLIEELRNLEKELFIVAMSGSPEEKEIHMKNIDVFLEKPVNIDSMLNMMKSIIQKNGL